MIQLNSLKSVKAIWSLGLILIVHNQVRGWDCPVLYKCTEGKSFYIWSSLVASQFEAKEFCNKRGLLLLKVEPLYLLGRELMRPNISRLIQDSTSVWLNARYDRDYDRYRWLDTNEMFVINGINTSGGDCVVATQKMTRIVSADCNVQNHIICMAPKHQWFGVNERFKCNCRSQHCLFEGTCFDFESGCAPGWFGQRCQLRDNKQDQSNKLFDFDSKTCEVTDGHLVISFDRPTYYSWTRLVLHGTVNQGMFSVFVRTTEGPVRCRSVKMYLVSKNTVDIGCCTKLAEVTEVIVAWHGQLSLCSVHTYRGQNIALRQKSTIISDSRVYTAPYLVDGYYGILFPSTASSATSALDSFSLEFSMERIVLEVIVYLKSPLRSDLKVTLQFKSALNTTVQRKDAQIYTFPKGTRYFFILSGTLAKVKHLTLNFFSHTYRFENNVDLSEVEVFGACAPPHFSLHCNYLCPAAFESNFCHYDGHCEENPILVTNSTTSTSPAATSSTAKMLSGSTESTATRTPPTATLWSEATPSTAIRTSLATPSTAQTKRTTTKKPVYPSECPVGYFGKSCQYLCHCKNYECQRDGRCTKGSICEDGWFALGCQYTDLAMGSEASDPLLTDNNDSSCYIPTKNVISANLTESFVYTWVRVVFSGYDSEECEYIRVVAEEKNRFDIFCTNEIVTKYIQITWQGNGSVCSLYINGGRNVAIESYIRMIKEEKTFDKNLLKDEITTDCMNFPSDVENKLIFRYTDEQIITRIIVYTEETNDVNNSFTLQGSFENNNVMFQYKSLLGTRHVVYLSKTKMSAVLNITFQVIEGSPNLCEIEVFGDCAPPYYYLACAETCILTCYKHLCNYNGFCYNCRHGRHGTHCMEAASGNDTKPWVDQNDVETKPKKKPESVNVYLYLFIPIFGFAAFFYNVLDLYQRKQAIDHGNERISDLSQATDGTASQCSSVIEEEAEPDDVDDNSENVSHTV